ncbi:MAG: hypothetical protein AAF960_14310 [Bacteroidota bacterium]
MQEIQEKEGKRPKIGSKSGISKVFSIKIGESEEGNYLCLTLMFGAGSTLNKQKATTNYT